VDSKTKLGNRERERNEKKFFGKNSSKTTTRAARIRRRKLLDNEIRDEAQGKNVEIEKKKRKRRENLPFFVFRQVDLKEEIEL